MSRMIQGRATNKHSHPMWPRQIYFGRTMMSTFRLGPCLQSHVSATAAVLPIHHHRPHLHELRPLLELLLSLQTRCRMVIHALPSPSALSPCNLRRRFEAAIASATVEEPGAGRRKANLWAKRKEMVKLPEYSDGSGRVLPVSEFLSHPTGVEALLNTRALQRFEPLDSNTYRCTLHKIQFLKFEVAPVLDLRVTRTDEDCTVEMLSCRFEGSKAVEKQNQLFSAFMKNYIKWEAKNSEPSLIVDVNLRVTLEVYTKPFSLLPLSAVEKPGNLLMQGLLDRLVPLLAEQLLKDYCSWVEEQLDHQT